MAIFILAYPDLPGLQSSLPFFASVHRDGRLLCRWSEPSGSPFGPGVSHLATGAPATSASVTAFGTAAGVAAGVFCARLSGAQQTKHRKTQM